MIPRISRIIRRSRRVTRMVWAMVSGLTPGHLPFSYLPENPWMPPPRLTYKGKELP